MSVKYGLDGQVAVVTGAANGFGLAVATRLADEGAQLVLVDRDVEALNAAADKLNGLAVVADVSHEAEVDGYVAAAVDAYGRIDLAASPYGVFLAGPSATGDIEGVIIHGAQGARSLTVLILAPAPAAVTGREQ